jgi:hypothetical protein
MVLVSAVGSESRFAAYVEGLASVIGHKDRVGPLLTIHQFLQTDQSLGKPQRFCRQV